jgi:hypothetical protein
MPKVPGRRWWWIGGAAALAVVVFVAVWFQPQKLFIDERVDEELPTAEPADSPEPTEAPSDGTATTATTTPPEPVDLAAGSFTSLDHGTTGTVRVVELADGQRFVRLEDLATDNGPDLFVYLSTNPATGPEGAFDDDFVNLGRLEGNLGNQNYELPGDVEPGSYASVVIWCDRFDSAFGAADLATA